MWLNHLTDGCYITKLKNKPCASCFSRYTKHDT